MEQKILLDISVLVNYPELLSFSKTGKNFIILNTTINEIKELSSKHKRFSELPHLIDRAIKENIITIDNLPDSPAFSRGFSPAFSTFDSILISYIQARNDEGNKIDIATDDKSLGNYCLSAGINVISSTNLKKDIKENKKIELNLNQIAKRISRKQVTHLVTSFISGIIGSIIASLIVTNLNEIIN